MFMIELSLKIMNRYAFLEEDDEFISVKVGMLAVFLVMQCFVIIRGLRRADASSVVINGGGLSSAIER
jgi:hypothetical protein